MPILTPRDITLLLDIYKYRYLSVVQVQNLHFPSLRTAYRRLQALTNLGYLKAFTVPHISGRVFYLDKPGAEVVAGELQIAFEELEWHRSMKAPKDYYFLRHFLAINDFRILLTKACNEAIILRGFIPEYFGQKQEGGNVKKYIRDRVCDVTNSTYHHSHTPDGVFALEKEGKSALFFLEIDRGTEKLNDPQEGLLKAVLFYLNYWQSKQYLRYEENFNAHFSTFRALFITTSGERIKNIRQAVSAVSFPNDTPKRFFWLTTERRIIRDGLFSPIWVSMERTDQQVYAIG